MSNGAGRRSPTRSDCCPSDAQAALREHALVAVSLSTARERDRAAARFEARLRTLLGPLPRFRPGAVEPRSRARADDVVQGDRRQHDPGVERAAAVLCLEIAQSR